MTVRFFLLLVALVTIFCVFASSHHFDNERKYRFIGHVMLISGAK